MIIETKFDLYDVVRDKISGYEGVVLGITQYDTGCTHYGLAATSLTDKGGLKDWHWFDTSRLEFVMKKSDEFKSTKRTGGPAPNAPHS